MSISHHSPVGHGASSTPPRGTILGLLRGRGMSQSNERSPNMASSPLDGRPGRNETSATTEAPPPVPRTSPHGPSYRIRLVPHIDSRRSLKFEPITRDLKEGEPALRIGRANAHGPQPSATSGKVVFKSKVVSRSHAELWVEAGGQFYVRDTRSSSGTFLNRTRLSPANDESPARSIKDGDILQLGVDYQGGTEEIYKSVKIRVELGREWQDSRNAFNTSALKNLKALASTTAPKTGGKAGKTNIPDCCICLYAVTIRQALFIAPCSHSFHYKCVRPLLEHHHPAFSCPLCRTFADLEDDVEVEMPESEEESAGDGIEKDKPERDGGAETDVEAEMQLARQRLTVIIPNQLDEEEEMMMTGVVQSHLIGEEDILPRELEASAVVQQVKC